MILLIVGATERAIEIVRAMARGNSFDIRLDTTAERPDWAMTATEAERADVMHRHRLPGYRVIELPDLGTAQGPPEDTVRTALDRMAEVGRLPADSPPASSTFARWALPFLAEWATWLSVDVARQKIASHIAFVESKHGAEFKGRMLFVVPDLAAFGVLSGLFDRLSREQHEVHVVVTTGPTDEEQLSSSSSPYPGLTVSVLSQQGDSWWQPLVRALRGTSRVGASLTRRRLLRTWPLRAVAARMTASIDHAVPPRLDLISALEDRKPDVLVVAPDRSGSASDYVRAARWLGIPSLCLPLRWNDLDAYWTLRQETPDVVAVWNEEQRRIAVARLGIQPDRSVITGALLPSDAIEGRSPLTREQYCDRMGIDPSRWIILVEAPVAPGGEWADRFHAWRRILAESTDPTLRAAAVVVFVQNEEDTNAWRRLASTGQIVVARAGAGERRGLVRLNESVIAADVVMATNLAVALEAGAHGKPVIALLSERNRDSELARFCRTYAATYGWPIVARDSQEAARGLAAILVDGKQASRHAATIVRIDDEGTGAERVYRLLAHDAGGRSPNQTDAPPPAWQRLLVLLSAAAARRFDRSLG